ncbi:MAG: polysaccharide biosynthesis/export family protein [Verrucomicrobiota bacterium]
MTPIVMGMALACSSFAAAAPQGYQLRAGDVLTYRVEVVQSCNQTAAPVSVTVNEEGRIIIPAQESKPGFVAVSVRGKTVAEVRAEVRLALAREYQETNAFDLTLTTSHTTEPQITLCGDIQATVHLDHGVNTHLAQAIQFFEPSEYADLKHVTISRQQTDGSVQVIQVNVRNVLKNKTPDVALQSGDIVYVPKTVWPAGRIETLDNRRMPTASPLLIWPNLRLMASR